MKKILAIFYNTWRKGVLMYMLMLCFSAGIANAADWYVATTGNDGSGDGSMANPYATIAKAISVASNGDVVNVANGTYTQMTTLAVSKELTILGASEAGTIIDVSGVAASGWGINPTESNTTLKNFTVIPNAQVAPPGGGFPIHAYGAGTKSNLTIENITVNASRRTGVDIHGYNNVTVKNVTSTNATRGNGIQFTGCNNVDISNVTTAGNVWGGIAVYVSTVFAGGSSSNINFNYSSSSIGEANIFYTETNPVAPLLTITGVTTPGLTHTTKNTVANFRTHYQPSRNTAVDFAVTLNTLNANKGSSIIEIATGEFWVGLNMSGAMSIQAAIDAASAGGMVNVLAGNYGKQTAVNRSVFGVGTYQFGLFIDKNNLTIRGYKADNTLASSANDAAAFFTTGATNNFGSSGVFVQANGVRLQGLKIGDNYDDSNVLNNNKTVEIVGNNFTMQDCWVQTASDDGAIYMGEWDAMHPISTYSLTENLFENTLVSINNGVGLAGARSGRVIKDNEFTGAATPYLIGFRGWNGGSPVQGWIVKPVGGAVVTGNKFSNTTLTSYIVARGNAGGYVDSELDWKEMWDDNTYGNHTVALSDLPTFDPRTYNSSGYTESRRISLKIQENIGIAANGDVVLVSEGNYPENVVVNKGITLRGANFDKTGCSVRTAETVINPATGNGMVINADNVTVNGFKFSTIAGEGIGSGLNYGGDASNVSIINNVFDDIKGAGIIIGTPNVLQNWTISKNKFNNIPNQAAMNPWQIANLTVSENCITNASRGIQLDGNTAATVTKNTLSTIAVQGIQVGNNCGGIIISQNLIDKVNAANTADRGGIVFYATSLTGTLTIQNNIVSNAFNGIAVRNVSGQNDVTGKSITITQNNLESNAGKTVYHTGTGILPVTCNWHGVSGYFAALATVSPNVDIVTRLTDGTDTNVPTVGFQPDLTKCKSKPNLRVSPVLECVRLLENGDYEAIFGYNNLNDEEVPIPIGNDNKFTPAPIGRGQPTTFLPGRKIAVFTVIFDGTNLVWTLKNPLYSGGASTSTASSNPATICKTITVSPIVGEVCAGGNTTVTFASTGAYSMGNTFSVELSAPNGSFASPTVLASGVSPLTVSVPNNIGHYKVRVVSSSPATTSNEVDLLTKLCLPACPTQSSPTPNLVVNGDFEAGATGFTSEYNFGNMYDPQIIAVTDNPNSLHTSFSTCEDHTSPGTKMLLVNGAEIPNVKVWCQNVSVVAGQKYSFTAWATSVFPDAPGVLELTANIMGINTGISLTPEVCKWTQFGGNWTATTTGIIEICIITKGTAFGGNDFAIDDISFGFACTPTLSATCPAPITVNTDQGVCTASVTLGTPTVIGSCPPISTSNDAPMVFPIGNTTVTWTIKDACGNTQTCTQLVIVVDNEKPTITCPANITVNNDKVLGLPICGAKVTYAKPTFGDNCPNAKIKQTAGLPSGVLFPVGTTTNTFVVTDAAGNTATCSFTVIVKDVDKPATVFCPSNITKNNDAGICGAKVEYKKPIFLDQCLVGVTVAQTAGLPSGSVFPVGVTTNTFTATDAAGNVATCSFTITVKDVEKPTITCPPSLSVNADAGKSFASGVALGMPTTADNCAVASVTNDAPPTFPLGSTTVTWTVTDVNGNTNTCTQKITVTDKEAPKVTCPANVNVFAEIGKCSAAAANVALGTPAATDNDGIASITNDAPMTFPVGTTIVIWTITDNAGNKTTCEQTVTVTDNQLPTITCPADIKVSATQGICSATVKLGEPTTADNCGVKSVSNDAPSTFPVGTTTVTWTVTDVNGNTATCKQYVVVTDDEKPILVGLPANLSITVACANVPVAPKVTATDNCSAEVDYKETRKDGNCSGNYVLTRTWTATDKAGNKTTATQTITVEDKTPPVVTCPTDISKLVEATATGANVSFAATANDACSNPVILTYSPASGSFFPVGTTTVTVTATDQCGNKSTCSFKVIISKKPVVCVSDCQTPKYASSVVSYNPGNRKNGLSVPSPRNNPANALGAPQNNDTFNFVALGFGGKIVLQLGAAVTDHNPSGGDIFVVETSFGKSSQLCVLTNSSSYPETAKIEGSQDGITFVLLGNLCRTGAVDVAPAIRAGMSCVKFLRITDTSNPAMFTANDDGFDVDGILVCPKQVNNAINALACAQNLPGCVKNNIARAEGEEDYEFDAYFINREPNAINQAEMSVFPNPASSEVNLDIIADESVEQMTIHLYNTVGVLVESALLTTSYGLNRTKLQISHLSIGMYFIKATSQDGKFTKTFKLVKE